MAGGTSLDFHPSLLQDESEQVQERQQIESERRQSESLLRGQIEVFELLAHGAPLPEILEALTHIVEQLAPDAVASILLLDESDRLRVGAGPSLPDEYNRAIDGLPADRYVGTCAAAAARGEVVITPDIASDPQWRELSHLPLGIGLKAAWSMPILAQDGKVLGTLGTYFRQQRGPTPHERQVVELLARTAAMVIERKQVELELMNERARLKELTDSLEERVQERTQQVRDLAAELTLAEQQERQRIARVLHDDIQQMLTALQIDLHLAAQEVDAGLQERLLKTVDFTKEITAAARSLSMELSPPALQSEGLKGVFAWLAGTMKERYGLEVHLEVEEPCRVADPQRRELVLQVTRELLFNIVKHAGVQEAQLVACQAGQQAIVQVMDDGDGFDAAAAAGSDDIYTGLGLHSIRQRLELFGGSFEIESAPGQGTRATVHFPIT